MSVGESVSVSVGQHVSVDVSVKVRQCGCECECDCECGDLTPTRNVTLALAKDQGVTKDFTKRCVIAAVLRVNDVSNTLILR